MEIIVAFLQVTISVGILNVWLVRRQRSTPYRGGIAINLKEEFATYGLPDWFFYLVGFSKVISAVLIFASFWVSGVLLPATYVLIALMLGALAMHIKVKDPFSKSIPAITMLSLCLLLVFFS